MCSMAQQVRAYLAHGDEICQSPRNSRICDVLKMHNTGTAVIYSWQGACHDSTSHAQYC